jgi:enoyl-[acyl-carrier protein] reductase III
MGILITGGTKGIGFAIAQRFAKPGAALFLNYNSDDAAADAAKSKLESRGAACHLIKEDVGTPQGARLIIEKVRTKTDRLEQVIHSAVRVIPEPLLKVDPDEFTKAVTLNGLALLYVVQSALPLLQSGSSIVFLSSSGGKMPRANYAAVGIAKSLAESLVRYLVLELAPLGIRINCVAPSAVDTQALRNIYGDSTDKVLEKYAARSPSGRNVTDDDYCGLIEFLASPAASMIQGQVIFVNGGAFLVG